MMSPTYFLPCLWAFLACLGFCILFNIHGPGILICALGGALGWLCYLVCGLFFQNDLLQAFAAGLFISAWSEVMARIRKYPVTAYLLVAFFPLVPGGGIYYAMEYAIAGNIDQFITTLLHTLGFSGSLAVGVLLVSSCVRIYTNALKRRQEKRPL
ncbi:MAG: threonine/serine exporter family protein [Oscillospiraceae bacterium]